ncbi:MAG: hypothetical protein Q9227_006742 [Pyrenula ochraceoflavens]
MKAVAFASLLVAPLAVAQPHHQHRHQHAHPVKRIPEVTQVVGSETTVLAYELNGQSISSDDVCNGIASGKLKWADGAAPAGACQAAPPAPAPAPSPSPSSSSSAAPAPSSSAAPAEFYQPSSSSEAAPSSSPAPSSSYSPAPSPSSGGDSGNSSGGNGGTSGGQGVGTPFPDGEHDCDYFPSDYGAMAVPYLGLGNWVGIQVPQDDGNAFNDIQTLNSGDCNGEGRYCQYACPEGTLQRQWPQKQGATGQSVGGLLCSGGKLRLTHPDSNVLCSAGVGNVQIKNNGGSKVSCCRTSYPGTESEVIPLEVEAGNSGQLACPDAGNFFEWKGMSTSAQYYCNPWGVGQDEACKWGDAGQDTGNFAPVNLGVGKKDGTFWLSIMNNEPTTSATFQGTIEIQGSDVVGTCKYDHGSFSGSGATGNGCTVSSQSGDVTYVVSQ